MWPFIIDKCNLNSAQTFSVMKNSSPCQVLWCTLYFIYFTFYLIIIIIFCLFDFVCTAPLGSTLLRVILLMSVMITVLLGIGMWLRVGLYSIHPSVYSDWSKKWPPWKPSRPNHNSLLKLKNERWEIESCFLFSVISSSSKPGVSSGPLNSQVARDFLKKKQNTEEMKAKKWRTWWHCLNFCMLCAQS